jgi:act minimal PKS chain-length factor (CLF/KS beta)
VYRGAHRYGEIAGYAATFDPRVGVDRPPGLRRAIELALADAWVLPRDVDVVFADAAGVPELDRQESEAIAAVFGPSGVPVTAPKTMTGRLYAGGSSLDVAAALLSIRDSVIPPTVNVDEPDWVHPIDLVLGVPREQPVRTALVLARGYGGFNAAMVLRATA